MRCKRVNYCGEAGTICPATTIVSSRTLSHIYASESSCRLVDWSSSFVARISSEQRSSHRRTWSTRLWHVCTTWCYLHTLTEAFQVLLTEFSRTGPKISDLLVAWCLSFVPQFSLLNELKKAKRKSREKKMRWLWKAKITVMYFQDIMFDDNTSRVSLFRHMAHTAHPVPLLSR